MEFNVKINISLKYIFFFIITLLIGIVFYRNLKPQTQESSPREIKIIAKQFSFIPKEIRLKLNEKVRLRMSSEDVTHGFTVAELGINEVIQPGKEIVIEFQASKRGSFAAVCSIICGTGHSEMRSIIIVE